VNSLNKVLDVGCGKNKDYPHSTPKGTVNCDVRKPLNKLKNFVQCDAQYLPFKDNVFDLVYSSHVIEHVDDAFLMLKELIRVSGNKVEVYTPHRMLRMKDKEHKCHFTKTWFDKALNYLNISAYEISISKYYHLPHTYISLVRLPYEIKVKIIVDRSATSKNRL